MESLYGKSEEEYLKFFLKDDYEELQEFTLNPYVYKYQEFSDKYPEFYEKFRARIDAGDDCFIDIDYKTGDHVYVSFSEQNIWARIMDKKIRFPSDTNIKDLRHALMVEEYIVNELRKLPDDQVLKSPLVKVKDLIEEDLQYMSEGRTQKLSFDLKQSLPKGLFDKIMALGKFYQEKRRLIKEDKIPPETKSHKYADDPEVFKQELPRIMEEYARAKSRQAKLKERKELLLAGFKKIAKYFGDRKLIRIETKKKLQEENMKKLYEKQQMENQINSAREIGL